MTRPSLDILNSNSRMAFGTYRLRGQECEDAVFHALKTGYRAIDTAVLYKNHEQVGKAICRAIQDGICKREDLLITTKVFNGDQKAGKHAIKASIAKALIDLQIDNIDLILLHSWMPDVWEEAWCTLQELQSEKLCTHIGVSNYYANQLDDLINKPSCHVIPAINQLEISPFHYPRKTIRRCEELKIIVQAHTPLIKAEKMDDQQLLSISEREKMTVAQLLLSWSLEKGWCMAVRSHDVKHIEENWSNNIVKTDISSSSMQELDSIKEMYITHPNLIDKTAIEHGI